jgi:hypothetical protein
MEFLVNIVTRLPYKWPLSTIITYKGAFKYFTENADIYLSVSVWNSYFLSVFKKILPIVPKMLDFFSKCSIYCKNVGDSTLVWATCI